jgi:hypothetical protein
MRALRRFTLASTVALATVLALLPAPAQAQEEPPPDDRWAVQPGGPDGPGPRPNFAYSLAPGAQIEDVVSISNLSDRTMTFLFYPKDAYNTPQDAAFALQSDEEEAADVGTWVKFLDEERGEYDLEVLEYTLEARTRVDVPFQLSVPADAEPGDHAGGIIAASTEPVEYIDQDGVAIAIRQRIGSRIYVRVDGPTRAGLEVTNLAVDSQMPLIPWLTGRGDMTITYEVENTGNLRLDSVATLKVTGIFGRTVRSFPVQELPELLPGSSVVITQSFSGLAPAELLNAQVVIESVDGQVTTSRSQRTLVWSWAVVVLLLGALAYAGYRFWRRRRQQRALAGPGVDGPQGPSTSQELDSAAPAPDAEPLEVTVAPEVTTGLEEPVGR